MLSQKLQADDRAKLLPLSTSRLLNIFASFQWRLSEDARTMKIRSICIFGQSMKTDLLMASSRLEPLPAICRQLLSPRRLILQMKI